MTDLFSQVIREPLVGDVLLDITDLMTETEILLSADCGDAVSMPMAQVIAQRGGL